MTEKKWYAVMCDADDDWGTGSYVFEEAVSILKRLVAKGYEYARIAAIDESCNPVCTGEYYLSDGCMLYQKSP